MNTNPSNPLVSVDWLYQNFDKENLIILDATIKKVTDPNAVPLEKEQIKGAVFFDIKNQFSDTGSEFPNTILPAEDFEKQARQLGVRNDSYIVVYDDHGIYSSPRVWWLFKVMGFDNVAVLDGGLPAWKDAGYPTEAPIENSKEKGSFTAEYRPEYIRFTNDVLSETENKDVLILDARSSDRFYGKIPEPRAGVRSGHIPGSENLPYAKLLKQGKFRSTKEIKEIFEKINPKNKRMTFSCGTGITACILALAAEKVAYTNIAVYDGSWTDWGSHENLPVEK